MPRRFRFDTDHTVYVLSKNFAVDLLENYRAMYGLKTFVFRLPTIYLWSTDDSYFVDGQLRKKGYRILIDRAIHGEPLEIWGDPKRKKDMVYVKDFCQMLRRAVLTDTVCHGHYNVGTGIGTTLEAQVRGIAEVFGSIGNIYPPFCIAQTARTRRSTSWTSHPLSMTSAISRNTAISKCFRT